MVTHVALSLWERTDSKWIFMFISWNVPIVIGNSPKPCRTIIIYDDVIVAVCCKCAWSPVATACIAPRCSPCLCVRHCLGCGRQVSKIHPKGKTRVREGIRTGWRAQISSHKTCFGLHRGVQLGGGLAMDSTGPKTCAEKDQRKAWPKMRQWDGNHWILSQTRYLSTGIRPIRMAVHPCGGL